mmetsp:Transcript_31777/g.28851  ORF Transcript_31777/g.28851 Transcript_31777/m.28851 type:complete len:95 (-) Transcript_31777:19-303(-)
MKYLATHKNIDSTNLKDIDDGLKIENEVGNGRYPRNENGGSLKKEVKFKSNTSVEDEDIDSEKSIKQTEEVDADEGEKNQLREVDVGALDRLLY